VLARWHYRRLSNLTRDCSRLRSNMVCCTAVNCSNKDLPRVDGVTFHAFPKYTDWRAIWIRNVRRKDWQPSPKSVLCSLHFKEECFEVAAEFRRRRDLKKDAVPTVFSYPKHLLPTEANHRRLLKRHPTGIPAEDSKLVGSGNLIHHLLPEC
jgi:THAP domain